MNDDVDNYNVCEGVKFKMLKRLYSATAQSYNIGRTDSIVTIYKGKSHGHKCVMTITYEGYNVIIIIIII